MGERCWVLVPEYRHKGKLNFVWCGPYKALQVLDKGENIILDISAPLDAFRILNQHSTKLYIRREGQPVGEFPMPPVKTAASPPLVKIQARRRVGSKRRRTFL